MIILYQAISSEDEQQ